MVPVALCLARGQWLIMIALILEQCPEGGRARSGESILPQGHARQGHEGIPFSAHLLCTSLHMFEMTYQK